MHSQHDPHIDEDRCLDLLHNLLPPVERDRIIAQAKEEAGRIIELARLEAEKLTGEHSIAVQAEVLAGTIEARARREADGVQREADEYVMEVLAQLETDLARTLTVVRNGIEKLQLDRQYHSTSEPQPAESGVFSE